MGEGVRVTLSGCLSRVVSIFATGHENVAVVAVVLFDSYFLDTPYSYQPCVVV